MFPVDSWRKRRYLNYKTMIEALENEPRVSVLKPYTNTDPCPFMCILKFDNKELRDYVLKNLIFERIYPAILWPLEDSILPGVKSDDRDFSRRMLGIHCDMRYSKNDMEKVANYIIKTVESYNVCNFYKLEDD